MIKFYTLIVYIILLLLGNAHSTIAQINFPDFLSISDSTIPKFPSSLFRMDYAVPDAPAFNLIEVNQSNILRPATAKDLAASVSNFIGDGDGLVIPRTFAVEFTPGLLIGGQDQTLADYRGNFLNWIRLSAATRRLAGAEGPSDIAFGLRLSLNDNADPRRNDSLLQGFDKVNQQVFDYLTSLPRTVQENLQSGTKDELLASLPDSSKTKVQKIISEGDKTIGKITQQNSSATWNNGAMDIAAAVLLASKDSVGADIQVTDLAAWFTYAFGIDTWGQVLIGLKGSLARDTTGVVTDNKFKGEGSAGLRLYIGTNRYKMLTEVQLESEQTGGNTVETVLINGGGEASLFNGTWMSFGGGVQYNSMTEQWDVVSKFTVKLGLPFL